MHPIVANEIAQEWRNERLREAARSRRALSAAPGATLRRHWWLRFGRLVSSWTVIGSGPRRRLAVVVAGAAVRTANDVDGGTDVRSAKASGTLVDDDPGMTAAPDASAQPLL